MDRNAWTQSVELAYQGYYNAHARTTSTQSRTQALAPAYFGDKTWKARASNAREAMHAVHIWCLTKASNTPAAGLGSELECLKLFLKRLYFVKLLQTCPDSEVLALLRRTQREHLELYSKTYSKAHCRPKHHFSLHHPLQYAKYAMLPNTHACESKHRLLKDVVETYGKRLDSLDSFATARMHRYHLQECKELSKDYWQFRITMCGGLKSATSQWLILTVGDRVLWPRPYRLCCIRARPVLEHPQLCAARPPLLLPRPSNASTSSTLCGPAAFAASAPVQRFCAKQEF